MKLSIKDGRNELYQFDTNRILLLSDDDGTVDQVEFSTEDVDGEKSWTSNVLTDPDTRLRYVNIPNEFLNGDYNRLVCYYVVADEDGQYTRTKEVFRIKTRQEPEDYYLEYTQKLTFAHIKEITEAYRDEAKDAMDKAKEWATKMNGPVEGDLYSARQYAHNASQTAQDLHDFVGEPENPETANTTYGRIKKAESDALDAIGQSNEETDGARGDALRAIRVAKEGAEQRIGRTDDEGLRKSALDAIGRTNSDGARGQAISALNEHAITGANSLKKQLDEHVNGDNGLAEDLTIHEGNLEDRLEKFALGEGNDGNGGVAEDMKDIINQYTTGTGSSQMFGKLEEETLRQKRELDNYTNVDKKKVLDDYAEGTVVRNKVDDYTKTSVDKYVETVAGPAIDTYVGKPTDSPEAPSVMGAINAKKQEVLDVYQSDFNTLKETTESTDRDQQRRIEELEFATMDLQSALAGVSQVEFEKVTKAGSFDVPTPEKGTLGNTARIGKMYGETVKSKNLLKATLGTTTSNGVTCTANGDGTYTLNGTASANTPFVLARNVPLNGTYRLLGCPTGGSSSKWQIYALNSTTSNVSDYGSGITLNESNSTPTFAIMVNSGVTCNNLVFKPMITTDLSATYADYQPYFEGLKDAEDIVVESRGKNLASASFTRKYIDVDTGAIVDESRDGWILTNIFRKTSDDFYQSGVSINSSVRYRTLDSSGDVVSKGYTIAGGKEGHFTISDSASHIQFCYRQDDKNTIQIEEGDKATSYEPYKHSTLTIPSGVVLRSAGNVRDEYDLESGKITRIVGVVDLGSLTWGQSSSNRFSATLPSGLGIKIDSSYTTKRNAICRYGWKRGDRLAEESTSGFSYYVNGGIDTIYIKDTSYADASAFKSAMSGVMLNYELAEPTEETVSPITPEVPVFAGGEVSISSGVAQAEVEFSFRLNYNVDTRFSDLEKKLQEQTLINAIQSRQIENLQYQQSKELFTDVVKRTGESPDPAGTLSIIDAKVLPNAEVKEITGRTRSTKNLWNHASSSNAVHYINEVGVPLKANTYYTVSFNASTDRANSILYVVSNVQNLADMNADNSYYDNIPLTVGRNSVTIHTDRYSSNFLILRQTSANEFTEIQLEEGNTPTAYEPYFEGLKNAKLREVNSVGANIWDEEWEVGGINLVNGLTESDSRIRSKNFIPVNPSTTYYSKNASWIVEYDSSFNFIGYESGYNVTFTTRSNASYIKFKSGSNVTEYNHDIAIFEGSTPREYVPYFSDTLTLPTSWQSIEDYGMEGMSIDLVNKKVTWTMKSVSISSLSRWNQNTDFIGMTYTLPSDAMAYGSSNSNQLVCDMCKPIYNAWTFPSDGVSALNNLVYFIFRKTQYATYEDVSSIVALNPISLVYKLATPVTQTFAELGLEPISPFIGVEAGGTVSVISDDAQAEATIHYAIDNRSTT